MATIELSLSSIRNNTTGRKQIRIRFYHGKRIDQRAKTGIYILDNPSYWDGHGKTRIVNLSPKIGLRSRCQSFLTLNKAMNLNVKENLQLHY